MSVSFNGFRGEASEFTGTASSIRGKSMFDFCSEKCMLAHFTESPVLESALRGR